MTKIAVVLTCAALTVALAACGGTSDKATKALAAQRAQIARASATLRDQQSSLDADRTALAKRKANAVADIKRRATS